MSDGKDSHGRPIEILEFSPDGQGTFFVRLRYLDDGSVCEFSGCAMTGYKVGIPEGDGDVISVPIEIDLS